MPAVATSIMEASVAGPVNSRNPGCAGAHQMGRALRVFGRRQPINDWFRRCVAHSPKIFARKIFPRRKSASVKVRILRSLRCHRPVTRG